MKKKTGLVFFPAFDYAISPTHPEREERLLYTQDQVSEEGLLDFDNIFEFKPDLCTPEDINRVHFCVPGIDELVHASHLISVGGTLTAADKVMTKEVDNAFALVRPCGHHSMRVVHGTRGFCTLNMEAIMVEYIREKYGESHGIKKIAIVDTDCHHGDGSQDAIAGGDHVARRPPGTPLHATWSPQSTHSMLPPGLHCSRFLVLGEILIMEDSCST